jgi:hypothetical protein
MRLMTFEVVIEILCVVFALVYGYLWRGPPGRTTDSKKLAQYRRATLGLIALGLIAFVRLLTHKYK